LNDSEYPNRIAIYASHMTQKQCNVDLRLEVTQAKRASSTRAIIVGEAFAA
jgi:hypothetical protein